MNILVLAKRHEGVAVEDIQAHITEEIQAVWDLYAKGICREFYSRADQGGPAVLMVESSSVEEARKALNALPLVALNFLDLDLIPLAPFTRLASLFRTAS